MVPWYTTTSGTKPVCSEWKHSEESAQRRCYRLEGRRKTWRSAQSCCINSANTEYKQSRHMITAKNSAWRGNSRYLYERLLSNRHHTDAQNPWHSGESEKRLSIQCAQWLRSNNKDKEKYWVWLKLKWLIVMKAFVQLALWVWMSGPAAWEKTHWDQ